MFGCRLGLCRRRLRVVGIRGRCPLRGLGGMRLLGRFRRVPPCPRLVQHCCRCCRDSHALTVTTTTSRRRARLVLPTRGLLLWRQRWRQVQAGHCAAGASRGLGHHQMKRGWSRGRLSVTIEGCRLGEWRGRWERGGRRCRGTHWLPLLSRVQPHVLVESCGGLVAVELGLVERTGRLQQLLLEQLVLFLHFLDPLHLLDSDGVEPDGLLLVVPGLGQHVIRMLRTKHAIVGKGRHDDLPLLDAVSGCTRRGSVVLPVGLGVHLSAAIKSDLVGGYGDAQVARAHGLPEVPGEVLGRVFDGA
mmetsp:Transcript_24701/g.71316  ORF Transcript_24701/g.71316 Transcript_24701/m.71316 type:complete len:302 (+) Transcript_24701:1007-1912(+)